MTRQTILYSGWQRLKTTAANPRVQRAAHRIVGLAIIGIIAYQLTRIGWSEVFSSLPTQPLFYFIFVLLYLSLPTAEIFIYRQVWRFKRFDGFKAFVTKQVYNDEVMGYSGELYLYLWGRRRTGKSDKELFKNIRDNSILSSVTSHSVAVALIAFLIWTGQIPLKEWVGQADLVYISTGVLLVLALGALVVYFRRYLFALPVVKALRVLGIYYTRFTLHHALLMAQWSVVMPETPLYVWFSFVTLFIVINRIPFLPSKELVFVWAGIEASRLFDMASATVAAMLLVSSALRKLTNLSLYLLIHHIYPDRELEELATRSRTEQESNPSTRTINPASDTRAPNPSTRTATPSTDVHTPDPSTRQPDATAQKPQTGQADRQSGE